MTLLQLIVIAIVQGVTEFLPISSSGHLYLTSNLLGWPDQGILVDAAVHLGTLLAVMIYCWHSNRPNPRVAQATVCTERNMLVRSR